MRRSNFISDIAKMANGAATALGGAREEIDNMIRQRMERALNARGLVTREEFDALRTRHEALAAQVAVLAAGRFGSFGHTEARPCVAPAGKGEIFRCEERPWRAPRT